jgi:hypothetical protein
VIAGDVHVSDHHRAGDLVPGLTACDRLVADGTRFISPRTPEDLAIGRPPTRRAVLIALQTEDAAEQPAVAAQIALDDALRAAVETAIRVLQEALAVTRGRDET